MPDYKAAIGHFLKLAIVFLIGRNLGEVVTPPCSGRQILNSSFGIISDGTREYLASSHCEWLIIGDKKRFISLEFVSMSTECTYDYLFVYDGSSFDGQLLGAFSGESDPGTLVAESGFMMVYFFSDRNYVRQGFRAKFYSTDCPLNCSNQGRCNKMAGICECERGYTGAGCQYISCSFCNQQFNSYNCTSEECRCKHEFSESRCNMSNPGWKVISEDGFKNRAGLSGAYVESLSRLFIFGGFDLRTSLDDLLYFDFKSRAWVTVDRPESGIWPSARHSHTMGILKDQIIFMFGGSLDDENFSNELWMFDINSMTWKLLVDPDVSLPPVTGHAMVITNNGRLYLLGGMTANGTFLSDFWRCDVSRFVGNDENLRVSWEKLSPKGGIDADRRLVGHSLVHDSHSDRLLIFGGIMVDSARFPRRSPSLQIYNIDENWWTDLNLFGRNSVAPRERAFHQAAMIGDYMVVIGGNVHSHHEDEHCYDGNIFFLHLRCLTWVDGMKFESNPAGRRYKIKGRYSHFATAVNDSMILVAGGFRGSLLGSLEAYVLPENMVKSPVDPSAGGDRKCALHPNKEICTSDPDCLWCSVESTYSCVCRTSSEKCLPGTLNHSSCPGICEFLKTCEACTIFGKTDAPSLDDCAWCVLESKCRKIPVKCTVRPNVSVYEGWWKNLQTQLVDVPMCIADNKPPGLLWLRYKNPTNLKILDEVELIRNSTQMFHFNTVDKEYRQEFTYMARMIGFIHPPTFPLLLSISGSTVNVWLYLSNDSLPSHKVLVAESRVSTFFSLEAKRPDGRPLFNPVGGKHYVEMVVNQTTEPSSSSMSVEVGLRWNITSSSFRKIPVIGTEFLEPPSGGDCSSLETCMSCLTDFSCGWCVDSCVTRTAVLQSPSHECYPGSRRTYYFVTNLTHCSSCSNHSDCTECLEDPSCEWSVLEARCFKRGQFNKSLVDIDSCPLPCHVRSNVSWCLQDKNECAWCEDTKRCFAFVEYIPRYPYGGCRMWLDSETDMLATFDCNSIKNCSSCINTHLCGWCYLLANPSIGVCHRGDFSGPYNNLSCDIAISNSFNRVEDRSDVSWSYESCEDVDECILDMHDCHENAECINTQGSYNCSCRRGFTGDGVLECDRTCYETCTNGKCSGPPSYSCSCDLGWKGESCNVDCGCHFHSSCSSGTCDECHNGTRGSKCQSCLIGYHGNSTSSKGCSPCECNGHADENNNICNSKDGACHCKHNTAGHNCQICAEGYYGDPRNSGKCFKECSGRSTITGASEGGIGTANLRNSLGHMFCLWVLSSSDRLDVHQSQAEVITLTIHEDVNISCVKDRLYVYDGIPDSFGFPSGPRGVLVASVCGEGVGRNFVFKIFSGIMVVFFEFTRTFDNDPGQAYYGFNATYNVGNNGSDWCGVSCENQNMQSSSLQHRSPLKDGDETTNGDVEMVTFQPSNHIQTCVVGDCVSQWLHPNNLLGYSVTQCSGGGMSGSFMFGGKNFSTLFGDLWFFEGHRSQWDLIVPQGSSFRPSPRYLHASECLPEQSEMFIHGGILADDNISDELWSFNIDTKIWSLIQASNSPQLAGHTMSLVNGDRLVVVGCLPFLGGSASLHAFHLNSTTWVHLPRVMQIHGLYGHSAAYNSRDQLIYIYGGYQWEETSGFQMSNHLFAINLEDQSQTSIDTSYLLPPSTMHSSFILDNLLIIIGGSQGRPLFHAYFPPCDLWLELDLTEITLPDQLQYFGKFWTDGLSIMGTAASGSLRQGGVTRLNFGGDIYRLIRESSRCQDAPHCTLCTVRSTEEVCSKSSTNDQQCFKTGRSKKQISKADPLPLSMATKECSSVVVRTLCIDGCAWCSKCSKCIRALDECKKACNNIKEMIQYLSNDNNDSEDEDQSACKSFNNCSDCLLNEDENCAWKHPRCDWKGCPPGRCHYRSTNSTTGATCSLPCNHHSTCSTCLSIDTTCLWSVTRSKCYSAYEVGLFCQFGECGSLISWSEEQLCPSDCKEEASCSLCLKKPHCGWCSSKRVKPDPGGVGVCMVGGLNGPRMANDCSVDIFEDSSSSKEGGVEWSFMECPAENECDNNHHNCNNSSQICKDTPQGFTCDCKPGFNYNLEAENCQPHCTHGCLHGECIHPEVCRCNFGYVGLNCSVECQCNKHSNCESEVNRVKCLKCHNNTMGNTCELCRPLYVGNPKLGGKCESCFKYCNEHSRICLSREDFNHTLNYPDLPTNEENIRQWLKYGSFDSKNTQCLSCGNSTQGTRCEKCKPGNFRQSHLPQSTACQKCLCNGHSDYCDPEKGDACDCRNNTKSPRCDSSDTSKLCFKVQCSQCVDNFLGTPTDGHQCYRQMSVESQHCFDPLTQMNCNPTRDPDPLLRNRTVFFAIQPKYLNVNIRIFIDVTRGGLNLYFAPFDNAFQVFVSPQDGIHRVVVDPTYKLYDPKNGVTINDDQIDEEYDSTIDHTNDNDDSDDDEDNDNDADDVHSISKDDDDAKYTEPPTPDKDAYPIKSMGVRSKRGFTSVSSRTKKYGSSPNRVPSTTSTASPHHKNQMSFQNDKQPGVEKHFHLDRIRAEGLTTFVTVDKPETFLFVENIVNRLVVILPNNVHPLKVARFYLVLLGVHPESYGSVYMRQDQPHIDLFVFFSVFFSCFFLFLAVCVLLWKAKQMNDARRSRHRSLLEMEHMASRPSAHVIVVVDGHSGVGDFYGKELRTSTSHQQGSFKTLIGSDAVHSLSLGAGDKLTTTTRTSSVGRLQNKRVKNFVVHPIAVEYTHDNAVAVATFLFELPGATTARIRSCFGSCIVMPSSNLQTSAKV